MQRKSLSKLGAYVSYKITNASGNVTNILYFMEEKKLVKVFANKRHCCCCARLCSFFLLYRIQNNYCITKIV